MCHLKDYLGTNKLTTLVAIYFGASILVKILFSIDILIPCLWKSIFHVECPGCGLTRSFIELLHCNFLGAYKYNPLIFIVLPAALYYIYNSIVEIRRKLDAQAQNAR